MLGVIGIYMGEDILFYLMFDLKLYMLIEMKFWRGIWVGDFSGYGFEFLFIYQLDELLVMDFELDFVRLDDEMDEVWEKRCLEVCVFCGCLEVIKLMGDLNVFCGEYIFVVDDFGFGGYVGFVYDVLLMGDDFKGICVVCSKGYVVLIGFVEGNFFWL